MSKYDNVIAPRSLQHIGDKFRRNGCPGFILLILSRIWKTRNHRRDPSGRSRSTCIYHNKQFHKVVVDTVCPSLNNKYIFIPHTLAYPPVRIRYNVATRTDGNRCLAVGSFENYHFRRL